MKRTSERNEKRKDMWRKKNTFKAKTFCTQRSPCFKNIPQIPKSKIMKAHGEEAVAKTGEIQTLVKR